MRLMLARMREPANPVIRASGIVPTAAEPERLPDIYYIILDAYARSDVMKGRALTGSRPR